MYSCPFYGQVNDRSLPNAMIVFLKKYTQVNFKLKVQPDYILFIIKIPPVQSCLWIAHFQARYEPFSDFLRLFGQSAGQRSF